MSITIREVLKIKEWQSCKVIAGEAGLDREVLCVDNMEVPNIIPWLRKNELLITTAYAVKENEELLLNIIKALDEQGCAGIALKTKFFGEITDRIKQTANEMKVPVIEIPGNMPNMDMVNPLMKKLVSEQNLRLEFSKAISEKFIAAQIEGGGFEEIGKILGELLQSKVIVTDSRQSLICCYPEHLYEDKEWFTQGEDGQYTLKKKIYQRTNGQAEGKESDPSEKDAVLTQKIQVKSKCNGILYVAGRKARFDEMSEIAIRQAALHLSLEFSKESLKVQQEYYEENSFFMDLINGNILSEMEAERRSAGLRWPAVPYRLVVADVDNFEAAMKGKDEDEIQRLKDEIVHLHQEIMYRKKYCYFVGNKSDSFYWFLIGRASEQQAKTCMKAICDRVYSKYGLNITMGVSREIFKYMEFERAYREARTAIIIGRRKRRGELCFIEKESAEELLFEIAKIDMFQKVANKELERLKEHDEKHGGHLTETLCVLMEKSGSKKETADALYLHRNTLGYRIRQIEQLTGYDLNDPKILFYLQLIIKARNYMNV